MLNSGPSGFYNAPISKALTIGVAASSIFVSVTQISTKLNFTGFGAILENLQLHRLFTHHFFFISAGELLFGTLLLYYFRLFERQMGSAKFGGFVFTSISISTLAQLSLGLLLQTWRQTTPTSGPYSIIMSCMVQFFFDIPPLHKFRLGPIHSNDKIFTYILGLQLMFSNYPGSMLSSVAGIIAGLVYRSDFFKLNRFKFPSVINNFCGRFILPLIQSPQRASSGVSRVATVQRPLGGNQQYTDEYATQGYRDQLLPPGFGNAFPVGGGTPPMTPYQPTEDSITALTSMGFPRDAVVQALQRSNGNIELATNLLLDQ